MRDAAKDIDEEIDRLNSLVNDVLDFARPIRFDPAPDRHQRRLPRRGPGRRRRPRDGAGVSSSLAPALPELDHRQRAAAHRAGQSADQRAITPIEGPRRPARRSR